MLWEGNRQIQEYTDQLIFTTVYDDQSFEPVSRLVQSRDKDCDDLKIYHYHNNHLGTPQELTDDCGNVIWANYEYAWGGTYQSYYKEQSLNDIIIKDYELQPIKFQGQSLDIETGLHYNRFRYYDSDVGMFIQRDPIGLLGGVNVFAYAPNPIHWVDVLGLNPKCRMTGKQVDKASDLPIVKPNTSEWQKAVESLKNGSGKGDIRVANIQDAKQLMKDAGLKLDRRKMYSHKKYPYSTGYEVHKPQPRLDAYGKKQTSKNAWKERESSVGNDLPHIKWRTNNGSNQGHIFFKD